MKKLVLIMAIVLVAGTAFGYVYDDNLGGGGGADPNDLPGSYDYTFQQSGLVIGGSGDPITEDTTIMGNATEVGVMDDNDSFSFEVGTTFDLYADTFHGYFQVWENGLSDAGTKMHYTLNGVVQAGCTRPLPDPGDVGSWMGLPAGQYAVRMLCWNHPPYNGVWGDWQFDIDVEDAEPVIPEPAGLGLVGLALLAVRKRRS